jgi:hypothetical protein
MRGDEHVWEHYGTPMVMKLKAASIAGSRLGLRGAAARRAPGNVGANLPTGHLIA